MIFAKLKQGWESFRRAFSKTSSAFGEKVRSLFNRPLNEETLEQLESYLFEADLGLGTAKELKESIKQAYRQNSSLTPEDLIDHLKKELLSLLKTPKTAPSLSTPHVVLVVGVNGGGKTTSVAKLAHRYKSEGKKVLIGAADTFRAGAVSQLEIWANRLEVEIVKGKAGGDPAAVVFDTLKAGLARDVDVILIDTAGRLQNKQELMKELEKVRRSCQKVLPGSPHDTLLVLDATIGQNGLDQAKTFHASTPLTGLILTKLDGTAKGGVIIPIQKTLGLPVCFIGIGEGIEDLEPFDPEMFVEAIFA